MLHTTIPSQSLDWTPAGYPSAQREKENELNGIYLTPRCWLKLYSTPRYLPTTKTQPTEERRVNFPNCRTPVPRRNIMQMGRDVGDRGVVYV